MKIRVLPSLFALLAIACLCTVSIRGQDKAAKSPDEKSAAKPQDSTDRDEVKKAKESPIDRRQAVLAGKYERLETILFNKATLEALENPRRASLLRKALQQSQNRLTLEQLKAAAAGLDRGEYTTAMGGQKNALSDLKDLLKLLATEDRNQRNKSKQDEIKEQIKEVNKLIRLQRSVQGRTEGGEDAKRLAKDQEKVANRTGDLAKRIKGNEETEDGEPKDGEPKDGEPKDGEPKDGEPKDGQPMDGQPMDGQPMDGQPMDGQPKDGQPKDGQQKDQQNSPQKRIEAAEQKMREAQEKLEKAKRDESIKAQEEAQAELAKAKAELEEILRQLREEEVGRMLALLEGRFRKMLDMQLKVHSQTQKLNSIESANRNREFDIQSGRLSFDERKIQTEAEKALLLLKEEGSSIAFPETVEMMIEDMDFVSARLSNSKVGEITLEREEDIIDALEEMLEALKQAQQDQDDRQQQQQQQQPNGPQQDPALVSSLAEFKMIRSLQVRVNKRTSRYSKSLTDADDPVGQAEETSLIRSLKQLSDRQERLQAIMRDIVLKRNQ